MSKITAMPFVYQKLFAFAFIFVFVLLFSLIYVIALGASAEQRKEIQTARHEIGRLNRVVDQLPFLRESVTSTFDSDAVLHSPSLSLARAELQNRVSSLAGSRSITLISLSNVSDQSNSGVVKVGFDLTVSGANNALLAFLRDLELAKPTFEISRFVARVATGTGEPQLTMQMRAVVPFVETPPELP